MRFERSGTLHVLNLVSIVSTYTSPISLATTAKDVPCVKCSKKFLVRILILAVFVSILCPHLAGSSFLKYVVVFQVPVVNMIISKNRIHMVICESVLYNGEEYLGLKIYSEVLSIRW